MRCQKQRKKFADGRWPRKNAEEMVEWDLPLILPARLMEHVFPAIDGEDTIFHNAFPVLCVSKS